MATEQPAYESYEGFLKSAIKAYWDAGEASKLNFLALLFACRETWQVAWDGVKAPGSGKKILTGAAGATALALLLRTVVGGPLGVLLTGATVASLVALYVKRHEQIWAQVDRYRGLIDTYRGRYEEVQGDWAEGQVRDDQRELMMDGLMSRFLVDLDASDDQIDEPSTASSGDKDATSGANGADASSTDDD